MLYSMEYGMYICGLNVYLVHFESVPGINAITFETITKHFRKDCSNGSVLVLSQNTLKIIMMIIWCHETEQLFSSDTFRRLHRLCFCLEFIFKIKYYVNICKDIIFSKFVKLCKHTAAQSMHLFFFIYLLRHLQIEAMKWNLNGIHLN